MLLKTADRLKIPARGFGFIEILLVLLIVLFVFFKIINSYLGKPSVDKETQKTLTREGIDTQNYKSVLDSSREKIQNINNQAIKRLQDSSLDAQS